MDGFGFNGPRLHLCRAIAGECTSFLPPDLEMSVRHRWVSAVFSRICPDMAIGVKALILADNYMGGLTVSDVLQLWRAAARSLKRA